jgi:hypothetical protein
VEISAPNDPYVGQSLRGRAPGWPAQDLEILDDNNKAQRNLGLATTPARGVESCEAALFGIVHNAATFRRTSCRRHDGRRSSSSALSSTTGRVPP